MKADYDGHSLRRRRAPAPVALTVTRRSPRRWRRAVLALLALALLWLLARLLDGVASFWVVFWLLMLWAAVGQGY